jgi:hypothetical protein
MFDVYNAGAQVGICVATGFVYCLLFIGIMSCFAEPLCWLCIVVVQLGLIALPILFGYKFYDFNKLANDEKNNSPDPNVPSAATAAIIADHEANAK